MIIENSEATNYLPIDYSKANKYIVGVNDQSNEFIVIIYKHFKNKILQHWLFMCANKKFKKRLWSLLKK